MNPVILGDGILGSELSKQTNWDCISRKRNGIDARFLDEWSHRLKSYNIIINCIANTSTYSCDSKLHWDVNYKFVDSMVDFCNKNKKKIIHISTDYIYSNSKSFASENDVPVHLETWYGYTKLLGDAHVQLKSNDYLIVRTSYKPYPFPYKEAWNDQRTNGDYVNKIASLIIQLIKKNKSGVYNVGTEAKSWFELTNKEFNTTARQRDACAPSDVTMSIIKMNSALKTTAPSPTDKN